VKRTDAIREHLADAAAYQQPVMSPAFAARRPDLLSITTGFTEDRHDLYFDIAVPIHQARGAMPDYTWRDWDSASVVGVEGYRSHFEPDGDRPALLTTTVVRIPAADWELPAPVAADSDDLVDVATAYVKVIAGRLNEVAGPVVADLLHRTR
jgi:hypothetical protein